MSYVKHITKRSHLWEYLEQADFLYMYCLSITIKSGGTIKTIPNITAIRSAVQHIFSASEFVTALNILLEHGWVQKQSDASGVFLVLGEDGVLFTEPKVNKVDLSYEKDIVRDLMETYVKNSRSVDEKNIVQAFNAAFSGKPLSVTEFIEYYRSLYAIIFQEPFRRFQGKDAGQFKTVIALYDKDVMLQMIFEYLYNSEKYGDIVSPGVFVYKKDAVLANIKKRNGKHKYRSTESGAADGSF